MTFRVLHVDDEPDIRAVVELALTLDPSLAVTSCGSGQEALAAVESLIPDLALLDVMMPVMDGPETLRQMRTKQTTAATPVVFMTARAQSREIESFIALGAVGVIPKPFDPMTLATDVRRYLSPVPALSMNRLAANFRNRAAADAATLSRLRSNVAASIDGIRDLAHRLAGAGGLFDAPLVSAHAGALALAADEFIAGRRGAEDVDAAIALLLEALDAH